MRHLKSINIVPEALNPTIYSLTYVQKAAAVLSEKKIDRKDIIPWAVAYITDPGKQRRIAYDLDYVRNYAAKDATIVDYGAIPLILTLALRLAGFRPFGVDLAPERFQSIIEELDLNVIRCDIERQPAPFAEDSCDIVTFNELFEHLRFNPIFTMQEVLRILKPGGHLLLSTPNLRSLNGFINFLLHGKSFSCCGKIYEEYKKLESLGHMGHVREYTPIELCGFLRQVGFKIETIIFRGQFPERWKQRITKHIPSLRPFMSIVARKPISHTNTDES